MSRTVTLLSPGAMGSAVAARLTASGATVLTSLDGRGSASRERAAAAGMIDAPIERLAEAELILSIVPPAEAEAVARRFLPHLSSRHTFIDLNALSPASKRGLGELVTGTGAGFVDGCIIGLPPRGQPAATKFYVSGDTAQALALRELGLDMRVVEGPVGAAAALKMCYAGINKGLTGLGTAMLLAASRSGAAPALRAEMEESQVDTLGRYRRQIPDMYAKAYRWVAEMREIAAFLGEDEAAAMIFEGMARLYERMAADVAGEGRECAMLDAFLGGGDRT